MASKKNPPKKSIFLFISASLVGLVMIALLVYNLFLFGKVVNGVYFTNLNLSFKSDSQAKDLILKSVSDFEKKDFILNIDGKIVHLKPSELGIHLKADETIGEVLQLGREGSAWERFKGRHNFFGRRVVDAKYEVDFEVFRNRLDEILSSNEKKGVDTHIDYKNGKFNVVRAEDGIVANRSQFTDALDRHVKTLSQGEINISFLQKKARSDDLSTHGALEKVTKLASQKITLFNGTDSWNLAGDTLLGILDFKTKDSQDYVFSLSAFPININTEPVSSNLQNLEITLNPQKVDSYINTLSKSINRPTVDATLRFEDGKVVEFSSAVDGQELDAARLKTLILDKVSINNQDDAKIVSIQLPVEVTKAGIANNEINSLGIKELIGRGVSYFAGSIPNRIHNLTLGSSLISGALIKPGEVFSFTKLVGPVSAEQGFKQAYVISKGRTVLDDGGGICQVSTTVFRAALNSGLPILKRTAHAYRVSYYEQKGFKPGMDATIWSPSVDLQFKNDTEHHILLQATVDRANSKLQVDIYGTSDGRKVELGDVSISNQSPAPEPLYQDDPTLPRGTIKQVDFAAPGATSVFTRKVYKGDSLIIDESFKSVFKPWQAVFLVGTG